MIALVLYAFTCTICARAKCNSTRFTFEMSEERRKVRRIPENFSGFVHVHVHACQAMMYMSGHDVEVLYMYMYHYTGVFDPQQLERRHLRWLARRACAGDILRDIQHRSEWILMSRNTGSTDQVLSHREGELHIGSLQRLPEKTRTICLLFGVYRSPPSVGF